MRLEYSLDKSLQGLDETLHSYELFDCHVHIWHHWFFKQFLSVMKSYNITHMLGIMQPKIKKRLEKKGLADNITFSYFLSQTAFARLNIEKLLTQVEEAQHHQYQNIKIFFGPRFLNYPKSIRPYHIDDVKLEPVYEKIESYGMSMLMHVADPDTWYSKKYTNTAKFGTKAQRIQEFEHILQKYPTMKVISAHLGCLPEELEKLSELLDTYPNLFVDTGSTRWMIRELGKKPEETRDWFHKYQDRILFGSDISNLAFNLRFLFRKPHRNRFWATRFWSHRIFWETSHNAALPFKDADSPEPPQITGLKLHTEILKKNIFLKCKKIVSN